MDAAAHHSAADTFAARAEDCLADAFRVSVWPWQRRRLLRKAVLLSHLALVHSNLTATDRLIADVKKPPAVSATEGPATTNPLNGNESWQP